MLIKFKSLPKTGKKEKKRKKKVILPLLKNHVPVSWPLPNVAMSYLIVCWFGRELRASKTSQVFRCKGNSGPEIEPKEPKQKK